MIFPAGTEIANEVFNALKHNKYFKTVMASSIEFSYANFLSPTVYQLPYVSEENFTSVLNLFISEHNIDFIIPAHDDVAYVLSRMSEEINADIIGQSREVNEIVRFKDETYRYFQDDLPIMKIYPKKSSMDFPVFVKPVRGQGSQDSVQLSTQYEYDCFFSRYDIDTYIMMEMLTGEEFTIDCFSHHGKVLYNGPRTRDKTNRGIAVLSRLIEDTKLLKEFSSYADIISKKLNMHGVWFFQMKYDANGELKLLEVGPRVSGTMMLNRAKGINFVELALYQKLGHDVSVSVNSVSLSLAKALVPKYLHNIEYDTLYIDFDDTLFLDEKYINTDVVKLIFQAKNEQKEVVLITKNKKFNLVTALHKFALTNIFDAIIHLHETEEKYRYMKKNALLIDDSFKERKEAIENGCYAYGTDNMTLLFTD
ncbi:MAG: ATP-grasp domain-containing protein [Thiovulaceae bacterium]|nr:ATP-grasp domain-containing protein [Sulfurimonadaceae bacterium]